MANLAARMALAVPKLQGKSCPYLPRWVEHCLPAKLLYHGSRSIAAVCLSLLGSNTRLWFNGVCL